jgi:hypothetical protein
MPAPSDLPIDSATLWRGISPCSVEIAQLVRNIREA